MDSALDQVQRTAKRRLHRHQHGEGAANVVAFYNKRGTCEQWIKEGKGAIRWTRLSCRSFAANAVRFQLHAFAYNLGNFLRTLATPEPIKDWSLTSLKEKLIKIGAKVVSHGRCVAFQMAEVAIPRNLFADVLRLIGELRPPPVLHRLGNAFGCHAFHQKPRETCVLMTENTAFLGAPSRAGPPETHLQATAGSQRHFSLAKVLLWAQFQPRRLSSGECQKEFHMNPSSRFGKFAARIACFIAAGLCLGATSLAKADEMAYMSANSGEFGTVFGTVDLNTGVFSSLGITEVGSSAMPLSGMADLGGTLYGAPEGTNDTAIYTINPANGALTRVGTTGISGFSFDNLGSTTTGLYVVDSSANLYSINPTTGAATLIGSTGIGFGGYTSLSTNASSLYFADGNNLYTLNTTTGAATLIGALGVGPPPQDVTIELTALLQENGTLYGALSGNPPSVATVDPTTGAATIGSDIIGADSAFITGLARFPLSGASVIPEPSTWAMMLLGFAFLGFAGYRRARAGRAALA
jgi:Transposase DDE domain group 1/PEP-CTERM motif